MNVLGKVKMKLSALGVLIVCLVHRAISGNQCESTGFLPVANGYYLQNHVVEVITAESQTLCQIMCYQNDQCMSYNYHVSTGTCDINDSDQHQHPDDLIRKAGHVYVGTENGCLNNTCPSNSTCKSNVKVKDHKCLCPKGFEGPNCNTDIDECTSGTPNCPDHSTCQNTRGSFDCACNAGYKKNASKCVPASGLEKSDILSSNSSYFPTLSGFLDPVVQNPSTSHWVRCWHATSDGWDVKTTFHSQCDGKSPTVTIVRVGKYVFGGYSDVLWGANRKYFLSTKSFLYSLYNINGFQPIKLTLTGNYNQYAIYRYSTYGPTFGRGHDLYISNDASSNTKSYTRPRAYHIPPGCSYDAYCSFFAGASHFTASDVEVFYETTN